MKKIISMDLGTTSARCVIFDENASVISQTGKELRCIYPKPGWVEQDPEELSDSVIGCVKEALVKAGLTAGDITAAGITNQRETVIVWDTRTGKPLCNAFVWQCNRGAGYIDRLDEAERKIIREKTGLVPSPYFSASKLAWLLDNVPGARELARAGHLAFGTPDTWLLYRLTGGRSHLTDHTNASRTMLFDIHRLKWDEELLSIFDIPASMLPGVKSSSGFFAETDPELFGAPVPVCGMAGDQQSALFGQCCFDKGDVKNTYGTGCFMLMNTGDEPVFSENGLLTTLSAQTREDMPVYATEGSVFMGGALINWLRDNLGLIKTPAETEELAEAVESNEGVYIVPAFTGLGAPYWKPEARGIITGLTRGTDRRHIARAALEAICYQCNDVFKAMEADTGLAVNEIKADGGVAANSLLMQFQSDITNVNVMIPDNIESTALGVFMLAGLGSGVFKRTEELKGITEYRRIFKPGMDEETRKQLLEGWRKALDRTMTD